MAEALRLPTPPTEPVAATPRVGVDPGGWVLLLVPTGICLVMFVVAALW